MWHRWGAVVEVHLKSHIGPWPSPTVKNNIQFERGKTRACSAANPCLSQICPLDTMVVGRLKQTGAEDLKCRVFDTGFPTVQNHLRAALKS